MKTGLVLEGGAMRGLFSAGIMDVMMEAGIKPDGIIGVSAGAAFGCNYKSRQPGRAIRYNKRFAHDKRYCSMRSWLLTGDLFGAHYAYHVVPGKLDVFDNEAFEQNPMEFWVVCTDVETGLPVYKRCDHGGDTTFDWVRASASMPVLSRVVKLENMRLLDGGMSDSIPLRAFQQRGFNRNIVIMTQPRGYEKQRSRLLPLIRLALRKYPRAVEAMEMRHLMYNEQLAYVEQEIRRGTTMGIWPDRPIPIGHISHHPDEMQRAYDMGRQQALRQLDEIKAFMNP